jgi:hypothetical protein
MAGGSSSGGGEGQGLVDISNTRVLSAETLSELSKYVVVLDGEGGYKGKPFRVLHNFRVRSVQGGRMEFPEGPPTLKPYDGAAIYVEGELRRTEGEGEAAWAMIMRVKMRVGRIYSDFQSGAQRGIWVEGTSTWLLLKGPMADFAPLMLSYEGWHNKVSV